MRSPFGAYEQECDHATGAAGVEGDDTDRGRGTRLGLSRTDPDRERFGVTLHVDSAATEEDWTAYRRGWVR